jgi:hypothetical protein
MDVAYPGDVTFVVGGSGSDSGILTASGGIFSNSYSQHNFNCSAILNGTQQSTTNVNEWQSANVHVQTAWLTGAGEDANDWRSLLRGWAYDSFTLSQAASVTADDGNSLTPTNPAGSWTASNFNLSIVSGAIHASTISGGTCSITRSFNDNGSWEGYSFAGYRYLTLSIQASANGTLFQIQITTPVSGSPGPGVVGTRTWSRDWQGNPLVANSTFGNVTIDLCAPTSMTAVVDNKDTTWPLHGTPQHYVEDTEMWGVSNIQSLQLQFSGLNPNSTVDINSLTLERKDHTRVDFLPAFNQWVNSDAEFSGSAD